MENIEAKEQDQAIEVENVEKDVDVQKSSADLDTESKKESTDDVQDELYTKIDVNTLTQNKDLAQILNKVLTLCSLSKTIDPKVITWVRLIETITRQEFEELSKIQKNFDFQIANRDFRNDEKLKRQFAMQEQAKMTKKLTSLVDVPMIDKTLMHSQIHLNNAEFAQLTPFFFSVKDIDIVAVVKE